jgi:hypothetical protein
MAPPRRWASDAARKAAYRDKRRGIDLPDDHYNSRTHHPEHQVTYAIEAGSGEIKLGRALHPEARLRDLQTGSPTELRILGVIPGGAAIETLLHEAFQGHHLRGEWYAPEARDDILTVLRILGTVYEHEKEE